MRIVVVLPAPFGPRNPWISPGATSRLTPSTAREGAEGLDEVLDEDHSRLRAGEDQQPRPLPSRRGSGRSSGRRSVGARPTRMGVAPGLSSTSSDLEARAADEAQDRGLALEAAAGEAHVRRVGGELVERGIHRQPQPPAARLLDPDLGPRVVVERPAQVDEAHGDARGQAERAGHGDVERGVLVAVADPGLEHLEGRGQAHRRLLLQDRVHVTHEALRVQTRWCGGSRGLLRLGDDLRRVALEEGLGPKEEREVGRGGPGLQVARVAHLDRAASCRLPGSVEVGGVECFEAVDAHLQPGDRRGVVDAPWGRGHEGRGLQHVRLDRPGDREGLGLRRRLADDDEAHGALLAHDVADVRDPGVRRDAGEAPLDPEGRNGPAGGLHDLPGLDLECHRGVAQRRGVEHRDLQRLARLEAPGREDSRQVEGEGRRLLELARLLALAGGRLDGEVESAPVERAEDLGRPRARVEREREPLEREGPVHARAARQADGRAGPEEAHLQPSVLPHLVAGVGGRRLADREADLVAPVVDPAPLRRGAVVGEVRGQGHAGGRPGPAGEHPHLGHPRHEDQGG